MGHQRPRGGSLPLPMDTTSAIGAPRRTIATHLEGVVLTDMDALVSLERLKQNRSSSLPMPPPPRVASVSAAPPMFPRRGSTSNCFSRRNPRRRRRRSSNPTESTEQHDSDEREATETTFFVEEDEPVPVLAGSTITVDSDRQTESDRGPRLVHNKPPLRPRRSMSLPEDNAMTAAPSAPTQRRRHTDQPKMKRSKKVVFKNAYEPEIMPDTRPPVQSYDELLFNVAGLYHTLSYLHDPDYVEDTDSSSSDSSVHEPPPPPERSMQLMIAEFLYRSAVYLGYPPDDNVWVPGFRETKKFSGNDVKRWRRLAHFDWAAEEQAFTQDEAERHALARASSRSSSRWTRMSSRTTATYGRESSTHGLRATVSNWLHLGRSSSRDRSPTAALVPLKTTTVKKERPLPTLLLDPPVVPESMDLSKVVEVANSCISYGGFRFTERQIRKLCNVPLRK